MPEPTAADQNATSPSSTSGSAGTITSSPGGASTPSAGSAAGSSSQGTQGSATSAATGSPAVSGGVSGTGGAAGSAAAPSFRDLLGGYGPQGQQLAAQFQDDRALVQHLLAERERAQQLAPYAPYAQQYAQHAGEFQAYLAQKQAEAQKQRDQQQNQPWHAKFWQPPEYDPSWEKLVRRDEQGNLVPAPGAPPDVVPKYLNYVQFRQNQAQKFLDNPYTFIEEPVKHLAQQIAEQAVQKHLGGYQDQVFAQNFTQQNAGWLYHQQNNQPAYDAWGRPQLSPQGQLFAGYVQQAEQMGLRDIRAQQQYALGMVQRDVALQQLQQTAQNGQAAKDQFLQAAAAGHAPQAAGSLPRGTVNGAPPPAAQNPALPLSERLRRRLQEGGLTDQVLQQQINQPGRN